MNLSQRLMMAVNAQPEPADAKPLSDMAFGPWLPDMPGYANTGLVEAKNVTPFGPNGYKPFKTFSATSTGALTARCQGAATVAGSDGFTTPYAGDATKLYRLVDATWTDASRVSGGAYDCGADEFWEFLKFNDTILACQITDAVQGMTIGGANFANQFTSTLKPKARHMCRGGRFLVLGNTDESATRVRWGKIDSVVDMDELASSQSGYRDIDADGGWIQRLIGGTYITIYQERLIQVGQYVGAPVVWRFDVVEKNRGCARAPYAVVALGRVHFYRADDGFFMFDGLESHPIGDLKVNRWFSDNAAASFLFRMCGAFDTVNQVVMWAFVSTSAAGSNPNPDRVLMYHAPSGWWAYAAVTVEWLFDDLSKGLTLEGLDAIADLDSLPFSLDSRYWTGGARQIGAFDSTHNLGAFTGTTLEATMQTGIKQLFPGRRARVTGCHVLADGGTPTVAIAGQDRLEDTQSFGSAVAIRAEGFAPLHSGKKFHAFKVVMPAASSVTHMQGIKPIAAPIGSR